MTRLRSLLICLSVLALAFGVAAQDTRKSTRASRAKPAKVEAPPPPPVVPNAADGERLLAAEVTLVGPFHCEMNQLLTVSRNTQYDGYIDVEFAKKKYMMKPVRSTTGAVRLEEVSGGMLMVQIPSKSMMMDTKIGQRVVDGCQNDEQRKEVTGNDSLGISAPGQVNTSDTQPQRKP
jgi:hypothetical protein